MTRLAPAFVCAVLCAPWPLFAQAAEPKTDFTTALGAFSLALDGSYGDERSSIDAALDGMQQALARWDEAIRTYEATMAAEIGTAPRELAARMHLALGGLYLDRHRLDDALRELTAAGASADRADVHTLLGSIYSYQGDMAAAAGAFRTASTLDPGNPIRAYVLAQQLRKSGHEQQAVEALRLVAAEVAVQVALQDRPALTTPFIRLALVPERSGLEPFFPPVRYRQGFERLRGGDYAGAVSAWREAAAGDPLVADTGLHRDGVQQAAAALRRGDVAAAIEHLTVAVDRAGDRPEPHRLLGRALLIAEQHSRAIDAFEQATRLDPRDERARLALADALAAAGRPADARASLGATVAALPDSGRARYALARLSQREGLYDDARRELAAAAALTPLLGLNGIYETLGALHAQRQEFADAVAAYRARVDLHPNDPDGHYDLGEIHLRQGRHEEALAELTIALLLDPAHTPAVASMAQAYLRMERFEAAAGAARRALDLEAAHLEARYVLGTALLRLGRRDEGRRELETFQRQQADAAAARTRQREIEGLRRDAAISAADGDTENTVALLRKVLALEVSDVSHLELGLALLDSGEPAEAIDHFTAAARLNAPYLVHRYLAEAYQALGLLADSRREWASYDRIHREALRRRAAGQ